MVMLCQLSYAVRSVRVCDISELSLVPSISMQSNNHDFGGVGVYSQVNITDVCDVTPSVYHAHQASLKKYAWPRWESRSYSDLNDYRLQLFVVSY